MKYFPQSTVAYTVMVCSARSGGEHTVDVVPGGTELERQFRRAVGQAAHTCNNPHVKCTGIYCA